MLCYMDRTYCSYHRECKSGDSCGRALTPKVQKDAYEWWGSSNEGEAPICIFGDKPECFVKKDKK